MQSAPALRFAAASCLSRWRWRSSPSEPPEQPHRSEARPAGRHDEAPVLLGGIRVGISASSRQLSRHLCTASPELRQGAPATWPTRSEVGSYGDAEDSGVHRRRGLRPAGWTSPPHRISPARPHMRLARCPAGQHRRSQLAGRALWRQLAQGSQLARELSRRPACQRPPSAVPRRARQQTSTPGPPRNLRTLPAISQRAAPLKGDRRV